MKIFWDTNVLVDLLLVRRPFYESASTLLSLADGTGSNRAREFHPHPLTEPFVKVSPHTALHTLCFVHMLLSSYPHAAMP